MARVHWLTTVAAAMFIAALAIRVPAFQQLPDTFFDPPSPPAIEYTAWPPDDPIARLNRRLQNGELQLAFEGRAGYLRSVLAALNVPVESQLAVFSKTSVQAQIISPQNPRSVFFNEEVAVAWPRDGFIEAAAQDPRLGAVFYALEQRPAATPQFVRTARCITCHQSNQTLGVPGMLLRSQPTAADGRSIPYLGNYVSDHRSAFEERWGGWYVTGRATDIHHLGNIMLPAPPGPDAEVTPQTLMLGSLKEKLDTDGYLSPYSDVVALTVFDHQMRMSNLLTRIAWEARVTDGGGSNGDVSTRVRDVAREVVDYMLFVDEAPLPARIEGTSGFAELFSVRGPRDGKGRSLHELDLEHRLLRYPCSYMIYADAFDSLPAIAKEAIYRRLWDVLSGIERGARYARLSGADREAIVEILIDTKNDLPTYFRDPL